MPIAQNTRISLDFDYEYVLPNEKGSLAYAMKFQHTDEYGPIIIISTNDGTKIELPAEMFVEVAQFLQVHGAIRKTTPVSSAVLHQQGVPIINKRENKLVGMGNLAPQQSANITQVAPITQLPQDIPAITIPQEEADNILKERAQARAKAKVDKAAVKPLK